MTLKTILLLCVLSPLSLSAQFGNRVFIENKGQWDPSIRFKTAIPGGHLELHGNKFIHQISNRQSLVHQHQIKSGRLDQEVVSESVTFQFRGANPSPKFSFESPSVETYNFYLGKDRSRWTSGNKAYASVTYHDLYDGIDLVYYYNKGTLKYDLIIKPGADPSCIRYQYDGNVNLNFEDGCITAQSRISTITENRPVSYQVQNGQKVPVESGYQLINNEVSFELGTYNPALPVVIDPELIFSTFSGSVSDNFGYTACFDDQGNLYSGGIVFGNNFPATNGTSFSGSTDIAILKYDSTGSQLEYATFIGGSSEDTPHSLIVNNNNELVILGTTGSSNYPVSDNAYDTTFNGGDPFAIFFDYNQGSDIVLTKLGPNGDLIASTFVGGTENDGILKLLDQATLINGLIRNYGDYMRGDVIVDKDDNVFVASSTESTDFPVNSMVQNTYAGGISDAVVFSLNADLTALRWSSFLGGVKEDAAYSIKLDTAGTVYVAGGTRSPDYPATLGALQADHNGDTDGFITRLDLAGDSILQSTFLGTNSYDQTYFIDIDETQSIFALGQTTGNYPVTPGIYNNPNSSQFIHKLTRNLDSTLFSTVFGSGTSLPNISPTAFLANECGNLFLSGWGGETNNVNTFNNGYTHNMPITPNALFPTTDGSDFYLMVLSADGSELLYATYYGSSGEVGDHVDGGTSRFDKRGIIYQSVCSCNGSTDDFPTTPNAWSTVNRGVNIFGDERCNNAAFKFDLASLKARFITSKVDSTEIGYNSDCIPFTVRFTNTSIGGEEYLWTVNGETFDTESFNYTFTTTGTYEVVLTVTDKNTCQTVDQTSGFVFAHNDQTSIMEDITICRGDQEIIQAFGGGSYQWEPATGLSNPNIGNPIAFPDTTTSYKVYIMTPNGCDFEEEMTVHVVNETIEDFEIIRTKSCNGLPEYLFTNNTETEASYQWDLGDGNFSSQSQFSYQYESPGTYEVSLTIDTLCVIDKTIELSFEEIFVPNVFTPNNDGLNDTFVINSDLSMDLKVFDRNGKSLYEQDNYQNNWDGTNLANDTYYYSISLSDGDVCNGWVQILR